MATKKQLAATKSSGKGQTGTAHVSNLFQIGAFKLRFQQVLDLFTSSVITRDEFRTALKLTPEESGVGQLIKRTVEAASAKVRSLQDEPEDNNENNGKSYDEPQEGE